MLNYVERNQELDEELDIAKSSYQGSKGTTYKIWAQGTDEEINFMIKEYLRPYWGEKKWDFNKKYNPNQFTDERGKKFWFFPPQPADGNWKRLFWWKTTNPEFITPQLTAIQNFIRDVNVGIAKQGGETNPEETANPKLDAFLLKLEQLKDFIEDTIVPTLSGVPQTRDKIKSRLEGFVNELASAVDDSELMEKVNNYLSFASVFSYSFVNTFLIYIQSKGSREVLSIGDWRKLNMQPKPDADLITKYGEAKAIGLWVPTSPGGGSLRAQISAENKWRENFGFSKLSSDATFANLFYNKKGSKRKLPHHQQMAVDKFVRKKLTQYSGISGFKVRFKFLDIGDVEQISEEDVVQRPEAPSWHTEEEDVVADKIYESAIAVIKDLGIKLSELSDEELGGAKGVSKQTGGIDLLATNVGIGRASTVVHELAHSLTHQSYLKNLYNVDEKVKKIQEKMRNKERIKPEEGLTRKERLIYDAYRGRQGASILGGTEILELQAEGVAFVILRYFGIDESKLKHSSTYIALWRGSKDTVTANLEIISQTAKGIIALMNPYMGTGGEDLEQPNTEGFDDTVDEPLEEEEILSFLYEMSIFETNKVLSEIIKTKKELLNGVHTKN